MRLRLCSLYRHLHLLWWDRSVLDRVDFLEEQRHHKLGGGVQPVPNSLDHLRTRRQVLRRTSVSADRCYHRDPARRSSTASACLSRESTPDELGSAGSAGRARQCHLKEDGRKAVLQTIRSRELCSGVLVGLLNRTAAGRLLLDRDGPQQPGLEGGVLAAGVEVTTAREEGEEDGTL